MIRIIDYGLGNIMAFQNVYKTLDIPFGIAKTESDLDDATKIILPGVGSFDYAMELLERSGMKKKLEERVTSDKIPVLGVCVGMQILANISDEGNKQGLGWINGTVKKFNASLISQKTKLPHMGWNDVMPKRGVNLFRGLDKDAIFYFLHSYYFECSNPLDIIATSDYGNEFACAVARENIFGVQFHPEKSHHYGSQLLKNFAEL